MRNCFHASNIWFRKIESCEDKSKGVSCFRTQSEDSGGDRQAIGEKGSGGNREYRETRNNIGGHRQLIAKKFDGSKNRIYPGRPRTEAELERLIVRMAQENRSWGYDRIVGALANLGYKVSDNTVGNILQQNGLAPAPERKKYSNAPRSSVWNRFLHRRGLDSERSRYVLCPFFHSGQQSGNSHCRNYVSSE